ncbi:LysM peptidoglycan-binding domain-containing protein [Microbulbifer sp. OS29]|uniref:LysM peptidoglycan-binding domain-containing protein n=1 Tax=Microbulbifer okhotskensis TaxID=2926617 RepID=A0A9X2EKK1_9GAMM|nr:LysM peptidoglycan-binding domain-containing protein [Microbulbifer okhotskensis]MCO1333295.1 LysM peptidoglycan-binding domain-containing protein [Microbulbifer okhotskensis]
MVHKNFAVALLAATVGACSQLPEQGSAPESENIQAEEISPASDPAAKSHEPAEAPPTPVDIWGRLHQGFALDHRTSDPKVKEYIAYFARNEGYMARVTERSRRYIFHVTEQLEQANLPLELALLPIVESAYDPFAYSHARASGMWQFIPATGRSFGLQQNWWYDGRRDVHESTQAAVKYFNYLHDRFDGDWELALAAYNAGEGTVRRAVERNRRKGLGTSYWDLKLPRETKSYIPQLLALAEVVSRPDHYKIPLHDVANEPYYARVDVGSQIDLAQAADLAEIEIEELYLLNPGYNRWATDPNGNHKLLIPVGTQEKFESALEQLPKEQRVSWQRYKIARGDTLSTIARRYQTTVDAIRETNKLRNNSIRAGSTLLIPSASGPAGQYAYALDQRVKKRQSSGRGEKVNYTVRPGDSLWVISRKLNVSVRQLASWNSMAPADTLRPGRTLVAYSGSPATENSRTRRKVSYRVRSGDSLYRIANKFSIEISDILRWNKISKSKYLQPGQHLTLFVDSANRS